MDLLQGYQNINKKTIWLIIFILAFIVVFFAFSFQRKPAVIQPATSLEFAGTATSLQGNNLDVKGAYVAAPENKTRMTPEQITQNQQVVTTTITGQTQFFYTTVQQPFSDQEIAAKLKSGPIILPKNFQPYQPQKPSSLGQFTSDLSKYGKLDLEIYGNTGVSGNPVFQASKVNYYIQVSQP